MEPPMTEWEGFEPLTRARSNTWPLPRPEPPVKEDNKSAHLDGVPVPGTKKNSSRRNAWGSLSYADLITQAIASAPEKRLTVSQIYEWMVKNISYFNDKGDSNSSAGWKNSVRHNLSLHSRFMRVQNEGTGKSSWWMINPDAKPGKSSRRRANSMETSTFEKRRGRIRKKVEMLRKGLLPEDAALRPSSSVPEGEDMSPDSFPNPRTHWGYVSEQLAGNFAEGLKLHPISYQSPFEDFSTAMGHPSYALSQCPIHRVRGCSCAVLSQCAGESLSPGGLSLSRTDCSPRDFLRSRSTPSTMMGQLMSALNSSTVLDDLNLNMEALHGGFDCNVEEVIKHELSMGGSLDFSFCHNQTRLAGGHAVAEPPGGASWVHER